MARSWKLARMAWSKKRLSSMSAVLSRGEAPHADDSRLARLDGRAGRRRRPAARGGAVRPRPTHGDGRPLSDLLAVPAADHLLMPAPSDVSVTALARLHADGNDLSGT